MSKRKNDHDAKNASTKSQSSPYTRGCGATPYPATPSRTTPSSCLSLFGCLSVLHFCICLVEVFVLLSFLSHLPSDLHIDKNGYTRRFCVHFLRLIVLWSVRTPLCLFVCCGRVCFLRSLSSFCPRGIPGDAEQLHTLRRHHVQHNARRVRKGSGQIQLSSTPSFHPPPAREKAQSAGSSLASIHMVRAKQLAILKNNSQSARKTVFFQRAAAVEFRCDPLSLYSFSIFDFRCAGCVFAV